MIQNYLDVLEESLRKKSDVLDRIAEYNLRQKEAFSADPVNVDEFDGYIEEKEKLIQELNRLDEGFESLYGKISEELQANKTKYADQIIRLKQRISGLLEKSLSIQAQEARNKELVELYFSKAKKEIRVGRKSSKAAYDYYRNMSGSAYAPPQFMDRKK